MDEIDRKQQNQINVIAVALSVLTVTMVVMMAVMFTRELRCPHQECPHYYGRSNQNP